MPYSVYKKGSYFGDVDCLRKEIRIDQDDENKIIAKDYRDSTAVAEGGTADVYVLKKKHID